jgi:hypothetical protein
MLDRQVHFSWIFLVTALLPLHYDRPRRPILGERRVA